MVPVRMLENGVVVDNISRKKGDILEVPPDMAAKLVKSGHAMHTVKVRVLLNDTIIGNRVCATGDEVEVAGEHAVALSNRGAVKIVTGLAPSLRERLVAYIAPLFTHTPGPFDRSSEPKVQVRVTYPKGAFLCGRTYFKGEVASIPESFALRAVDGKVAEWVGTPPKNKVDRPAPIELAPNNQPPTESYTEESYSEESPEDYPQGYVEHTVSDPHSMPPTESGYPPE